MKHSIVNIFWGSFSLILTILIDKFIFKILGDLNLPFSYPIIFWGSFLLIFIVIFGLINIAVNYKYK